MTIFEFFLKYKRKMVGAGGESFDKAGAPQKSTGSATQEKNLDKFLAVGGPWIPFYKQENVFDFWDSVTEMLLALNPIPPKHERF
jgi:hypothetical protein